MLVVSLMTFKTKCVQHRSNCTCIAKPAIALVTLVRLEFLPIMYILNGTFFITSYSCSFVVVDGIWFWGWAVRGRHGACWGPSDYNVINYFVA